MSEIVFVSDFTYKDYKGGAEMYDRVLQNELSPDVKFIYSNQLTPDVLEKIQDKVLIFSNFHKLPSKSQHIVSKSFRYFIIEHDYKFCKGRNPSKWKNNIVPKSSKMNMNFLESADKVMCQSRVQKNVYEKNVTDDVSVMSLDGTLFNENVIKFLSSKSNQNYKYDYGVVNYSNKPHKGKKESIEYCQDKNLSFHLISKKPYKKFLESLSEHRTIIFIPQWPEPFNRFYVECKMMGIEVETGDANIGAEEYIEGLDRKGTIRKALNWRKEVVNRIEQEILS